MSSLSKGSVTISDHAFNARENQRGSKLLASEFSALYMYKFLTCQ